MLLTIRLYAIGAVYTLSLLPVISVVPARKSSYLQASDAVQSIHTTLFLAAAFNYSGCNKHDNLKLIFGVTIILE